MILRLAEVVFLGFLCGLIPGPVVTAVFTETIRKGRQSARRIVYMAAVGELIMSITCVLALSFLDSSSIIFSALSIFGSLILFSLSWDLWKTQEISEHEPLFSNRRIFMVSLLNGMAWIFWITVCTPQAMALDTLVPAGKWLFILLFELGWLGSTLTLSYLFGYFRPYFQSNKNLHILYRSVAILFVLFAIKLAIVSTKALIQLEL
jgi:threonine/homoserine/homoserine lactone efflux protein